MRRALAALLWLVAVLLAAPLLLGFVEAAVWVVTDRSVTRVDWSAASRTLLALGLAAMAGLVAAAARQVGAARHFCRHRWAPAWRVDRVGSAWRCEICGHAKALDGPDDHDAAPNPPPKAP
jgi:hypothetical protein